MPQRADDIRYLRGLAARLRSLALTESRVAGQLLDMAAEAAARADALEASPDDPPSWVDPTQGARPRRNEPA